MTSFIMRVEALDVLMFRDGRPFNQGEQHTAKTVFPPPARTLHGAIRAQLLRNIGLTDTQARRLMRGDSGAPNLDEGLRRLLGSADDCGAIRVTGPFLGHSTEPESFYLPAPEDLNRSEGIGTPMAPLALPWMVRVSDVFGPFPPLSFLGVASRPTANPSADWSGGGWISSRHLDAYLDGTFDQCPVSHSRDFHVSERRVGIAFGAGRATEGMVYEAEFVRLHGTSERRPSQLVLDVDIACSECATLFSEHMGRRGALALGGEARLAAYSLEPGSLFTRIKGNERRHRLRESLRSRGRAGRTEVVLYVVTDSCWREQSAQVWYPARVMNWLQNLGLSPQLRSAAVARFKAVAGWQLAERMRDLGAPRPVRLVVPGGAVYHLSIACCRPEAISAVVDGLHGVAWSDEDSAYGLGYLLLGLPGGER